MQKGFIKFFGGLMCVAVILALSIIANAQFKAGLQGTVTDPTGAVISGATVTLTSNETQLSQAITTSDDGFYRFSGLAPGLYTMTVEIQNFKKQTVENIKIDAETLEGVDVVMSAGGISETVTVEAENTGLETEDANVRNTLSTDEILRLPQAGRDPYELARLTPGVFGAGARGSNGNSVGLPNTTGPGGSNNSIFATENQVPISANGQRLSANNFQIDGVSVNSQTWGGAAVITPSQESVKEVQVTSSTYSAEDGRNSGATIKVVTQNGTNDFHGSLFFKYNDPSLNAYNRFGTGTRVENKFRQYGGSLGGPIWRDKLFFFFTYEGARSKNNVPYDAWIETPQYRQRVTSLRPNSVTSQIFAASGIEPRIISVLPGTCTTANIPAARCQVVSGGLDIGSPTGVVRQYVDGFSPSIGGGFDGIPDIQFARLENPTSFVGNQYNTRIDYNFSDRDRFTVSTFFTPTDTTNADTGARSRPMADITSKRLNWSAAFIYNRVISASMFNEFRFNINRWGFNEIESNPDVNFGIPRVEVEGFPFDRIRFGANRSEGTPGIFKETQLDIRNTFNWVIGNQNLKIGGEFRKEINDNSLIGGARPLYSFVGLWNLANDAPIFEAVNADPNTGAGAAGERKYKGSNYALFVQDDWKFRPNLTLNLGLRWEYYSPLTDKSGQQSNLFLGPRGVADAQVRPVKQLFESDWNNFGPQLGFAWSPAILNGKGVIRGGGGIGYNRLPNAVFLNSRGNPPFFARYGLCCGNPGDPFNGGRIIYAIGSSNSPTSYPTNPILGQGINPTTGTPRGGPVEIYGSPQEMPTAYVYRYSLEGQYELPYQLIGTLGYQGSAGRHFVRLVNLNFIYPVINTAAFNAIYFPTPDVNTNYNGMNARLQRRFANGFQVDAIYRWSKSIDTLSYEGPGFVTNQTFPVDNSTERGPSDFDVRHFWVISGLWDLPILRNNNSLVGKLLGGWQINGIWTYHTGFPWTPKIGPGIRSPSGEFFGPIRPVRYLGGAPLANTNDNFLSPGGIFPGGGNTYFQTTLNPGDPTYLNNPPGVGRNVFRGPKYRSLDLSLVKRFRLDGLLGMKEGAGLDLRANFFNVFNQLNLANFGFGDDNTFADRSQFGRALNALAGRTAELQVRFNF
ncbi:MAG: TonB-dependent receptor [Acidobacteriota bacterium]|nr:TonB-dependent receptor [Acidobacteriota bacterium]